METKAEKKASGFEQLRNMFNTLDTNAKVIISGALVIVVVGILLMINYSLRPDYVLLYGGLDLKDASEIIQELDSQNQQYKVRAGGRDVLVPLQDRDKLRITLAGKGFLPSTPTGYELFDKNRMTLSTFEQKVDFKRAQEGELARTLMSIEEIEYARVHLVIPDPSPFFEETIKPSASVVLKLRGVMRLNPEKISAVANLVATAVGGMDPKNITIMDDRANLLAGGGVEGDYGLELMPNQQKFRQEYEESVKQKVKGVIEPAYGPGNVAVAVSADFDFNKVEEEKTIFEPVAGSDTGILRSHEVTESTSENAPLNESGVAGATTNIPSYQGGVSESGSTSKTSETSEIKNYEINETQKKTIFAQGAITKQSISVLINMEKLEANEKTEIEDLVKAAANIDNTRGDIISIAAQVFDTTFQDEIEKARAATISAAKKSSYIVYGIVLLTAALFAFALFKLMKPVTIPTRTAPEIERKAEKEKEEEWEHLIPEGADFARTRLREDVFRMTKDHPEETAKVVKSWLKE